MHGKSIWWSGPGEVTDVNVPRDPGSENGLRTEAAQLSLLNAIPEMSFTPASCCPIPVLTTNRKNRLHRAYGVN